MKKITLYRRFANFERRHPKTAAIFKSINGSDVHYADDDDDADDDDKRRRPTNATTANN